jgi:hypothetical protein
MENHNETSSTRFHKNPFGDSVVVLFVLKMLIIRNVDLIIFRNSISRNIHKYVTKFMMNTLP